MLFNGNNASTNGGALYLNGGITTITNKSTFNNNKAINGGGIYTNSNLTINSIEFSSNIVSSNGAGLYINSGTVNILNDSNFINNKAINGSGVYSNGKLVVNSVLFLNNNASANGGAIYSLNDLNIFATIFNKNNANSNGGAIFTNGGTTNINSNSAFTGNSAVNGACIYSNSNLNINSIIFSNNTAKTNGGALYLNGGVTNISGTSNFTNNRAINGGAIYSKSKLFISSSLLSLNNATGDGGVLYSLNDLQIINSTFNNNKANSNGGTIYSNAICKITNSNFKNTSGKYGSAIYSNKTLNLTNVAFSGIKMNVVMVVTLPYGVKYYYNVKTDKSSSPTIVKVVLTKNNNIANAIWQTNSGNTFINNKKQKTNSGLAKEKVVLNNKYSATTNSSGTAIIKFNQSTLNTFNGLTKTSENYKYNFSVKYNGNSLYSAVSSSLIANAKITSHKVDSYWNLMTKKTGSTQINISYQVNKNGWYKKINNKWVKQTKIPSISGKWYVQNSKTKKYSPIKIKKFPSSYKTTYYGKHTENINTGVNNKLKPYVFTTLTISTKINGKTSKYTQKTYVASTTDIYFKDDLTSKERLKYNESLINHAENKKWVHVNHSVVKKQLITLLRDDKDSKINGELTSLSKAKAIYTWVGKKEKYSGYSDSHHSDLWSIEKINKIKGNGSKNINLINCADHSNLVVSLLRTAGIPAVYAHSKVYGGHYWACAYVKLTKNGKTLTAWHWLDTIHPYFKYNKSPKTKGEFKDYPKLAIDSKKYPNDENMVTKKDLRNHLNYGF
ncbi:transglutaminase-like domain-containing protein [Methanobrevibacter curvatus]|uniref:transglutaminase-like domain-containing protein n=1 Tax=Methanobrevibacter curvatus TaxID=49547 RepID=UPI001471C34A|nr:transglutaminase-like domain-containing protein [Methanobrevibacter curvatus]